MTQYQYVENQLRKNNELSRNQCLRVYITRLAEYIGRLRKRGWEFTVEKRKTNQYVWCGTDYVYIVKSMPKDEK